MRPSRSDMSRAQRKAYRASGTHKVVTSRRHEVAVKITFLKATQTTKERKRNMKLKVNWKELMRKLWAAIKPALLGVIGGGIVSVKRSSNPCDMGQVTFRARVK